MQISPGTAVDLAVRRVRVRVAVPAVFCDTGGRSIRVCGLYSSDMRTRRKQVDPRVRVA